MAYNADSVRSTIRSQIRQLSSGPAGRSPTYSPATTSNPSSALLPLTPKQSSQRSREEKKQQQQQQQQQPQKWRPSMSLALNNSQQQHPLQEAESEGSRHLQSEQGGTVVVHGEIAPKQNNIEQEEKEKAIREKERKLVPLSKSDRHPAAATPGDVGGRGDTMAATATGGYRRSSTSTTYSTRESSPELSFKLDSSSSNSNNTSKSVSPIPPPFFPSSSSSSSGVVGCLSSERVRTPVPADSPLLGTKPPAPANQSLQRVKCFNRNLRRARSFRAHRERTDSVGPNSGGRCRNRDSRDGGSSSSVDPDNVKPFGNTHYNGGGSGGSGNYLEPVPYYKAREVTFLIKRSTFGRKGWKVMPQEEGTNLRMLKAEVMEAVMARIRELELSGLAVPEQMTLSVR